MPNPNENTQKEQVPYAVSLLTPKFGPEQAREIVDILELESRRRASHEPGDVVGAFIFDEPYGQFQTVRLAKTPEQSEKATKNEG